MASKIRNVGGFRIDGDLDDLQLVLISDVCDELIRYQLTPEIVFKLAIEFPRCADQLADGRIRDDRGSS